MTSAGPGSPLDNATKHSNDTIAQINLLDPTADLEATTFSRRRSCRPRSITAVAAARARESAKE